MNAERLLKLADVLDNFETERRNLVAPVDSFDIGDWHCGTAACAVGTAMLHPHFRALGLVESPSGIPQFGDLLLWDATKVFFGLGYEAWFLFGATAYPDQDHRPRPADVAASIRAFVAGEMRDRQSPRWTR